MKPLHAGSQCRRILRHLKRGNRITPLDALELFGCLRLSERIREIEAMAFLIRRKRVKVCGRKWVMSYWLVRR